MANLAQWIRQGLGEPIAVVIGAYGWGTLDSGEPGYGEESCPSQIPREKRGVVLKWADARPLLDYEFDPGYGAPRCHAVYVWSKEDVLFISQYDGSVGFCVIPREPRAVVPEMPGG